MKSASDLFEQAPKVQDILKGHQMYWAHLPGKGKSQKEETLHEHVELVNQYALRLIEVHGLDKVFNSLCTAIAEHRLVKDKPAFAEALKVRSIYSIIFHDFGKVNPNFQIDRMKNNEHFKDRIKVPFHPPHGHSELSAFLYNSFFLKRDVPDSDEGQLLLVLTLLLSYPILNHHAKGLFSPQDKFGEKISWIDYFQEFAEFEAYYGWVSEGQPVFASVLKNLHKALNRFWKFLEDDFPLYALIKLNFSVLTSADYLATSDYMNQEPLDDFGVIDESLSSKIITSAKTSKSYNSAVFKVLEDLNYKPEYSTELGNDYLNELRKEMAVDALRSLNQANDKRIFYLEAPTGGGKTNISMLLAAQLLEKHTALNKIVYVFPFTTLVTQTFSSILETFDLTKAEVAQVHAKAAYRASKEEGAYGTKKINYLHNLFYHYPIALLTHIRFFDWLKTNFKESNYPFHRLANTIVIIDELQSYNPKHWDKIIYLLEQYARHFNIYFLLMSATLPKLGDLLEATNGKPVDIHHLLPNAKQHFFQNPNFNRRVTFDFSLLSETIEMDALLGKVLLASADYAKENDLYPKSVYTIVEFIFKKSASAFYSLLKDASFPFFDEVLVLSGTILEPRRKEVINQLKSSALRSKKVLLITTQVVEAGVDIDMDVGFKDSSLIDSDEQLAGRINRNVKKKGCKLYLFRMDKASIIYQNDLRYQQVRNRAIKLQDYQRILQEKDFDHLYDLVFKDLSEWNKEEMAKGLGTYRALLRKLQFIEVHQEFKLIEQDNVSVFVPLQLPIEISGKDEKERVFSQQELDFLKKGGIEPKNEYIYGDAVFDFYIRIVQDQAGDYVSRVVSYKQMQSILSKFTFSVFASQKLLNELRRFSRNEHSTEPEGYEEFGYLYLSNFEGVYNYYQGLNESAFEASEQQFL
jgi:CRISPR-associated endonuclease/helicase Cas3